MERLVYEKLIAEYSQELPLESLRKVLTLIEVLNDKEKLHKKLEYLKLNFHNIANDVHGMQC